jgi:pimeloyl-ACP methyl ester carboxylesterase
MTNSPARRLASGLLACAAVVAGAAAQQVPNNLVHPPGYVAAKPETLARVAETGQPGDPSLILIPGLGFGASVYDEFAKRNAQRFHSIAVTLPGYEGSAALPMPPDGTSYGEQTWSKSAESAIAALIRDRKLKKPIVVGHFTHGGQVALRLAIDHPELVGGAVVAAGELSRAMPSRTGRGNATGEERVQTVDRYWAAQWFKTVSQETWSANLRPAEQFSRSLERGQARRSQSASVPLPVMVRYFCEFLASDLSRELDRLEVPVLVIVPGFSPELLQAVPNLRAQLHDSWNGVEQLSPLIGRLEIPNARIFVIDDEPAAFDAAITAFMRKAGLFRDR